MTALGLGRGVDATNTSPWLNKSDFQVREVTPFNIIGTEEGEVWKSYSHEVTSVLSLQTSMSASVPMSQQVTVGVDAELSRGYSMNKVSIGNKIITRKISFKADFEDLKKDTSSNSPEYPREGDGMDFPDSGGSKTPSHFKSPAPTFEERLAEWIIEHLPEENKMEEAQGSTNTTKVAVEDCNPTEKLQQRILNLQGALRGEHQFKTTLEDKCRDFINHFCITHYVSSIELGASKYQVMSEEDYQMQVKMKGSLGLEQMVSAAVEQKASQKKRCKYSETTIIGRVRDRNVVRGSKDEAVVGVKFQPISALVRTKILREQLQRAITKYIDNQDNSKGQSDFCHMVAQYESHDSKSHDSHSMIAQYESHDCKSHDSTMSQSMVLQYESHDRTVKSHYSHSINHMIAQ